MTCNGYTPYLAALLIGILLYSPGASQGNNGSRVLFVYMRLKENVLTLEKTKVVTGAVKTCRAESSGDLCVEITGDKRGRPLHSRLIRRPGKIHYDYIDSDGRLRGGLSEQPEELFVIKVPFDEAMKEISFYATKPPVLGKVRSAATARDTLIASFQLNLTGEQRQ